MADKMKKTPMPEQAPEIRRSNFEEVSLGYTPELAAEEAARCLNCKNRPCVSGCPVNVQIPDFIAKLKEGDVQGAYRVISATNGLPAVCGRVCPQESQCEKLCIRGIKGEAVAIGRLERFVADTVMKEGGAPIEKPNPNGHRAAVIGGGPAGLTCAGDLARAGFAVTLFEAFHIVGGVLVYGIPEFRLPKDIVQKEIDKLAALGVEIRTDCVVGRTVTVDELMEDGYEAIFLSTGAGLPRFMNIPGESLMNVLSANEFLTRVNLMKAYKGYDTPLPAFRHAVVVGGGNVAMDAARCALRTGAEVDIVYRRSEAEMPARAEEIHHAKEEGINFRLLTNPVSVKGDEKGKVCAIECIEMELSEPDESGRRRPVEKAGSEFLLDCDCVIMALGTSPNPLIRTTTPGLDTDRKGCLVVNGQMATTRENIWAGGDAVTGAATVILAMGAGKAAAKDIIEKILG